MQTLTKVEEILVFLDDAPLAQVGGDFQLEHEGVKVGAVVLDEVLREHHFGRLLEELQKGVGRNALESVVTNVLLGGPLHLIIMADGCVSRDSFYSSIHG